VALGMMFSRSISAPMNQVLSRTNPNWPARLASSSMTPVLLDALSSGMMWESSKQLASSSMARGETTGFGSSTMRGVTPSI